MFSANSPPDFAPLPSKICAFSATDPLLVSAQLTTKPPLDSAVTEGVSWSPAVVVLTRNSPPTLAPVESNSCPITPRPLGSVWPLWSTQMMTKPPEASFTTFGSDCSPAVALFARNSPASRPIRVDVVIETPAPAIPARERRGRFWRLGVGRKARQVMFGRKTFDLKRLQAELSRGASGRRRCRLLLHPGVHGPR